MSLCVKPALANLRKGIILVEATSLLDAAVTTRARAVLVQVAVDLLSSSNAAPCRAPFAISHIIIKKRPAQRIYTKATSNTFLYKLAKRLCCYYNRYSDGSGETVLPPLPSLSL